ncbi:MAG: isoprenylcysteine carboxylmethyltransferase family protein [Myxococcales bacterium]|nr:isoprenylcysteine carboxylmethyltransferase family protein [Myxococcales bacterium]MCB9641875.1 isoprenylcysteine carboxylmethyltransferase family protein [Myxococcales bacterium]
MPAWFPRVLVLSLFSIWVLLRLFYKQKQRKHPPPPIPESPKISISPQSPRQSARVNQPNEGLLMRLLRKLLVGLFVLGTLMYGVVLPYVQNTHDWGRWLYLYTQIQSHDWVTWGGLLLSVLGLGLFAWSHQALAHYWSAEVQVRADHQLIQRGPYKRVRHPMYTSLFCFFAGVSLIAANLLLAVPALLVSLFLLARTPAEERLLTIHLGLPYREYAQVTGRYFPTLRKKKTAHRPR